MTAQAELKPHELQALTFLAQGPDCIGTIDSEEKMAAALVFLDLERAGFVSKSGAGEDMTFTLSAAGVEAVISEVQQ